MKHLVKRLVAKSKSWFAYLRSVRGKFYSYPVLLMALCVVSACHRAYQLDVVEIVIWREFSKEHLTYSVTMIKSPGGDNSGVHVDTMTAMGSNEFALVSAKLKTLEFKNMCNKLREAGAFSFSNSCNSVTGKIYFLETHERKKSWMSSDSEKAGKVRGIIVDAIGRGECNYVASNIVLRSDMDYYVPVDLRPFKPSDSNSSPYGAKTRRKRR